MNLAFRPSGPAPAITLAPRLESIVGGYIPANCNMIDVGPNLTTDGAFANMGWPDFSNTLKWDRNQNLTYTSGVKSPDGAFNAQTIVPTVTNGNHTVFSDNVNAIQMRQSPIPWRLMVIARPNGYSRLVLDTNETNLANAEGSVTFDLAGVQTNFDNSFGSSITLVQAVIQSISSTAVSGFCLCYFDFFINTNATYSTASSWIPAPRIWVDNGSGAAARSVSFAGDGTSGLDIWWFSLLPVGMYSLTNRTWFEDFRDLSSIDVNNTKAPGFKYYPDIKFNLSVYGSTFWSTSVSNPPAGAGDFTQVEASTVRIQHVTGSAQASIGMFGATTNDGTTVIGTGFFRGAQAKETLRKDVPSNTLAANSGGGGGIATWGASLESMNNVGLNSLNGNRYTEWDPTTDAGYLLQQTQTIAWTSVGPAGTTGGSSQFQREKGAAAQQRQNVYNRWTGVWLPAHFTGVGYGMYITFFNGVGYFQGMPGTYSLGGGFGNNGFDGSSQSDNHQIVLLHTQDAGQSFGQTGLPGGTTHCDYEAVWQLASPVTAYTFWDVFDKGTDLTVENQTTSSGLKVTKPTGGGGTIALDGHVHGNTTSGTSFNVTLTTTSFPDLICVAITANGNGAGDPVVGVTSSGLTFTKRAGPVGGSANTPFEFWTAVASTTISQAITINVSNPSVNFLTVDAFGISGANTASPFDANGSLPGAVNSGSATISTSNANDMLLEMGRSSTASPSTDAGFTAISSLDFAAAAYKIVSSTQSGLALTIGSNNGMIADAIVQGSATWESIRTSVGKTAASGGKWYWELTLSGASIGNASGVILGICDANADVLTHFPGGSANGAGLQYNTAANTNVAGSVVGNTGNAITWAANDVIGFAFDSVAGKMWIHKNGSYLASMLPGTSTGIWSGMTSGAWYPAIGFNAGGNGNIVTANFGQTAFSFSIPAGYTGWTQIQQ